jgi:micrococcal nuclease
MRWLFPLVGALVLSAGVALAEDAGPLLRIVDGDTFEMLIEGFPNRVRLANADAPETGDRARCPEELEVGLRAGAWVREQVATRQVAVFPTWKLDKYRRPLVYVTIDGEDLGALLVKNGLGRAYHGERRMGWCPER